MWPFKSRQQQVLNAIDSQYGDYLRVNGFDPKPEVSGNAGRGWTVIYRSDAFHLRIVRERGHNNLLLDGAETRPGGNGRFEAWYPIYHVAKWLNPSVPLHPKWTSGPEAAILSELHAALVQFFSPESADQRKHFVEAMAEAPAQRQG